MANGLDPGLLTQMGYDLSLESTVIEIPQTSTHPFKEGWNPNTCSEIAKKLRFPPEIWDSTSQRAVVIRFLTFYATGNVEDIFEIPDVILAMASLCFKDNHFNSEDLIWEKPGADDKRPLMFDMKGRTVNLSHPTPQEDSQTSTNQGGTAAAQLITVTDFKDLQLEDEIAQLNLVPPGPLRMEDNVNELLKRNLNLLHSYQSGDLKKFIGFCTGILASVPAAQPPTKDVVYIYRLCNMLALTMLRAVTKTNAQLTAGFLKRQFRINITNLIGGRYGQNFAPPCSRCLDAVCTSINKSRQDVSCMIANVVTEWVKESTLTVQIRAIMEASFLTHTSWNGLGILDMLFVICDFYATSWLTVMRYTAINSTANSWRMIIDFMKTHQTKEKPDRTVPWARVIDDAYFKRYGPMSHYALASLFVASIEGAQGESAGIEDAIWAVSHRATILAYREASIWLREQLSHCAAPSTAATKESLPLLRKVQAQSQQAKAQQKQTSAIDENIL